MKVFYHKLQLRPKNGGQQGIIDEFYEDPLFIKQVEITDKQIIIQRICPHGHPRPIIFSADEYYIDGMKCLPPQDG